MDETAMASRLEDVVWYSETPLPDVNGMGRLAMAQKAHERGFKVVLTGEFLDLLKCQKIDVLTRFSSRGGVRRALWRLCALSPGQSPGA